MGPATTPGWKTCQAGKVCCPPSKLNLPSIRDARLAGGLVGDETAPIPTITEGAASWCLLAPRQDPSLAKAHGHMAHLLACSGRLEQTAPRSALRPASEAGHRPRGSCSTGALPPTLSVGTAMQGLQLLTAASRQARITRKSAIDEQPGTQALEAAAAAAIRST